MNHAVAENRLIDSPFEKAKRHFRFFDESITMEAIEWQRVSSCFIPDLGLLPQS